MPQAGENPSLTLVSDDCNVPLRDGSQWCSAEPEKENVDTTSRASAELKAPRELDQLASMHRAGNECHQTAPGVSSARPNEGEGRIHWRHSPLVIYFGRLGTDGKCRSGADIRS